MGSSSKDLREVAEDAEPFTSQRPPTVGKDEALEVAIKAAETSMQALRLAKDPKEKTRLSKRVKQLLDEAETIKQSKDGKAAIQVTEDSSHGSATIMTRHNPFKEPQSSKELSKRELLLLLNASFLNGSKFPPWTSPPDQSEFELKDGEEAFLDAQDLPLSEFQEGVFDGWKRPIDALPPPTWFSIDRSHLSPSTKFPSKIDLVQDAATDCSLVSSLCAAVARAERGHSSLLHSLIHPFDATSGQPLISKSGKYVVRLNFNGCYRKVIIDDRLPVSSTPKIIHVVDANNPGLLWPALLEKAYLKVRGGYDFPGSNSATDIWILSGWIPEQIFLQFTDLEPDRFWRRVSNGFKYGDVLVTMGTGKMSTTTEQELGLAGEHDYAVLDLKEVDGQRLFLIKNPWCEGTSWRGKLKRSNDDRTPGADGSNGPALIDLSEVNSGLQTPRDLLNADDQLSPGTFWMDLNNVIQHFESIYLNWNPGLFAFRQDVHFPWDLSTSTLDGNPPRSQYVSLIRHPQYTVTTGENRTIWILLWRHFRNAVTTDAAGEVIEPNRRGTDLSGHMSLAAFSSGGHRVLLTDHCVQKGWFVDSPQILLQLECHPAETYTLVPLEQELPATKHTFTLCAFSNSPITLTEANGAFTHVTKHTGNWTKETAGGNAHSPTYTANPQFSIAIQHSTSISLLLESMNDELNVHVKLVHSKGKRIHSIRNRDIVFDSKDYRRGCCVAEFKELEAGQYTIICSTFEPHQLGDFTLFVESTYPTQVTSLPREGAGRMRLALSLARLEQGGSKVAAPLIPHRLVRLYAIARYLEDRSPAAAATLASTSNRSLIRISIEIGRGPDRKILTLSNGGEYSAYVNGIRTEDIDLRPDMRRFGDIWLVVDRMNVGSEGIEESVFMELFIDQPNAVACGDWRAWDD